MTPDRGITGTVVDALGLLWREARHWLPIVAVLAMIAALPEALLQLYMPDPMAMISEVLEMDVDMLIAGLGAISILLMLQLVIQLLGLMFAFVILADLSAGRTPDVWAGLRRLASWKLQFAWLVAGLFEQTAISLWFLGGGLLLLPLGLATTTAYEEDNGFTSFSRSIHLGMLEMGVAKPGTRIAVAVTLGFFVGFLVTALISLISCATSAASAAPGLLEFYTALQLGEIPEIPASPAHRYGWLNVAMDLVLAPLGMLPTVFMMTVQQMTYWQARRFEAASAAAP